MFFRTERPLNALEKQHGLKKRWETTSPGFISARKRLENKRKRKDLLNIRQLSIERTFLLEMKRKYAGGYTF
jgi:hypothetical protein